MTTPVIRAALERLLNDLQCLTLKSQGVSGLCRDGDLVTWPDLLKPGGCYSPWIRDAITAARDALAVADAGGGEALLAAAAAEGEGPILQWTDNKQPCDECRYDHCTAETPFGRFLISWKSWKRFDSPTVDETPWGDWHKVFDSVDAAKAACQREMDERIAHWGRPAAPTAPPKGEAGELVAWLNDGELVAWLNNHAAHLRTMEGIGALPETELQERLDRAATLIQQQAAELAALRAPQGGEVV